MKAWSRERSQRIEADIILGETRRFIRRVMKSGSASTAQLKAARRLMRSINRTIRPVEGEPD